MENKSHFRSLSRRADFLKLKAEGQVFHVNSWLLVSLQRTDRQVVRCGWTISRHIGTAVVRNRLRRWGREYLRKAIGENLSLDMNLVFKRREIGFYKSLGREEFDEAMAKILVRLQRLPKSKMGAAVRAP